MPTFVLFFRRLIVTNFFMSAHFVNFESVVFSVSKIVNSFLVINLCY